MRVGWCSWARRRVSARFVFALAVLEMLEEVVRRHIALGNWGVCLMIAWMFCC